MTIPQGQLSYICEDCLTEALSAGVIPKDYYRIGYEDWCVFDTYKRLAGYVLDDEAKAQLKARGLRFIDLPVVELYALVREHASSKYFSEDYLFTYPHFSNKDRKWLYDHYADPKSASRMNPMAKLSRLSFRDYILTWPGAGSTPVTDCSIDQVGKIKLSVEKHFYKPVTAYGSSDNYFAIFDVNKDVDPLAMTLAELYAYCQEDPTAFTSIFSQYYPETIFGDVMFIEDDLMWFHTNYMTPELAEPDAVVAQYAHMTVREFLQTRYGITQYVSSNADFKALREADDHASDASDLHVYLQVWDDNDTEKGLFSEVNRQSVLPNNRLVTVQLFCNYDLWGKTDTSVMSYERAHLSQSHKLLLK